MKSKYGFRLLFTFTLGSLWWQKEEGVILYQGLVRGSQSKERWLTGKEKLVSKRGCTEAYYKLNTEYSELSIM